jgi:molybdate transport system substrate-binding protein
MRALIAIAAGLFWSISSALAADIVVLVDGPARPAMQSIAEGFKQRTGHGLTFVFAPGPALNKRVIEGDRADVIITPKRYLDELQTAAKANVSDAKLIGGAGFALAVRKGGTSFDVSTAEALKASLLRADAVVFNNLGSGNYFATVIERLSLTQTIASKIVRTGPDDVFDRVAKSSAAEIAVGTAPLVIEDARLQMIGELPAELQSRLELFAAPLVGAPNREPADAFIAYLTAAEVKQRLSAAGLK